MLTLLRRRALCHTPIIPASTYRRVAGCRIRHVITPAGTRPGPSTSVKARPLVRHESAAAAEAKRPAGYKYPEWLNVYRLGSAATLSVGFFRVVTICLFGVGALAYAPSFYYSPDHSNWWMPAFILASAVPMLAMIWASGPFVHSIKVQLPAHARRTREGVLRLANNVPPNTRLEISSMKLRPWPTKMEVVFADLRKHNPSWKGGLSNLEWIPLDIQDHPYIGTWSHSLLRRFRGVYYVLRDQKKDRSAAPGVWDKMWEQIPTTEKHTQRTDRKPSAGQGRTGTELKPLRPAPRTVSKTRP